MKCLLSIAVAITGLLSSPLLAGKSPAPAKGPAATPAGTPGALNLPPAKTGDPTLVSNPSAGQDPYQFERFGVTAANSDQIDQAREFFEKSWELGELPTAPFNLACLDVREGKIDSAFKNLEKAIAAGLDDESILMGDKDLVPLRAKPEFSKILAGAKRNRDIGDAAVLKEGLFIGPEGGKPSGILILFHDASSDPMAAATPFLEEAKARGFYLAVPRGPSRVGKKRFGWGPTARALKAAEVTLQEVRQRTGSNQVPVMLFGIGRGGVLAFNVAMRKPGTFAGVGSIGGPFNPDGEGQQREKIRAGLKGTRLFMGVAEGADQGLVTSIRKSRDGLRYLGLVLSYSEWPGTGSVMPPDSKKAVRDALDALSGGGAS